MDGEHGDVWAALRPLSARVMSVPLEAVVPEARLVADLGADSLDITELEAATEEVFGVSLKGTDKSGVSTVGDVATSSCGCARVRPTAPSSDEPPTGRRHYRTGRPLRAGATPAALWESLLARRRRSRCTRSTTRAPSWARPPR